MSDYKDREKLLAKIDEAFFETDPDGKEQIGVLKCRAIIREFYDDCPSPDVAPVGWISVKDKLPEPEQDVLVIAHGWSGRLLYIGSYQRMEAETSWLTGVTSKASDWSLWGWSYLREPEVTHWMPLPEPPMSAKMDGGTDNG